MSTHAHKLNGRLRYVARTMRMPPEPRFAAAEVFSPESAHFAPHGFALGSYCYRDELGRIIETNVPGAGLKFHRLTEGPAEHEQIIERFGERSFVKVAHIAGFMRNVVRLSRKGQLGELAATVTFLVRASEKVIALRVGLFDYIEPPTLRFSFGATHELPDIHMGLIGHY